MSKSKIILIIDDDEDDIELFCDAAKNVDHDVECISVSNGEDALRKLDTGEVPRPQYIFLDLNLPGLHGKQCLKRLKNHSNLRDIPVIIYTTSKLKEDIEETRILGASHFLTKPNRVNDLRIAIARILNSR